MLSNLRTISAYSRSADWGCRFTAHNCPHRARCARREKKRATREQRSPYFCRHRLCRRRPRAACRADDPSTLTVKTTLCAVNATRDRLALTRLDTSSADDQHACFRRRAMLKNNPMMKRLVETGEERMGRVVQQLLSNEKFVATVQTIVSRSLAAKGTLDKSIRAALSAMNLPSAADLENVRTKVDDLERMISSLEAKIDSLSPGPKS